MNYLFWTVLAMVSYSFVFLFVKLSMRDLPQVTTMTIAISVLMAGTTLVTVASGDWELPSVADVHVGFAVLAGLCLTGAVVGYFRALTTGPVSVVVPIYGLFLVGGSVLGIIVLNEPLTARKAVGVVLAVASIVLLTT